MVEFHLVERNLRESFRVLAENRERGETIELPGVSIASAGVRFQMFNAAFLSAPVATVAELDDRLHAAEAHFRARGMRWSLWVCEDWLAPPVRKALNRRCERMCLRPSTEMPGMMAGNLLTAARALPRLEFRHVDSAAALADFQALGSLCFHVPVLWFREVFDDEMLAARSRFRCTVAYRDGVPVATAATIRSGGVVGLYNIATDPGYRKLGVGEAVTRHAAEAAGGAESLVLQATEQGYGLYRRLGFRPVTRILVYASFP